MPVTLGRRPIRLSTESPKLLGSVELRALILSCRTFLDSVFRGAHVQGRIILGRCIKMVATLGVQLPKLISSKAKYALCTEWLRVLIVSQVTGDPLRGQVSQSGQWAVSGLHLQFRGLMTHWVFSLSTKATSGRTLRTT